MKELRVRRIKNGTVIDHISVGMALKVLSILRISTATRNTVSVIMNVPSKKEGKKDIVKVENRELQPTEVDKIALIAPRATINIIRDYEVVEKHSVALPQEVKGIVRCTNPNCISNLREPIQTRFKVLSRELPKLRCYYCERIVVDVVENIL